MKGGLHRGETSGHFRTVVLSCPGTGPLSDLDTGWIRWTAVNLGIYKKTKISVDAILLMMYQVHQDLRQVFPVPAGLNFAA